jgi:DNA-binding winged helix-turn-helix (wHTH) protein
MERSVIVRFGECVLDTEARLLHRSGEEVHLTPKAFDLLELLVERRPRATSKVQIHERLWPSTFVSEVNLATLVFEIRTAIGDDARSPRWVRTVRKYGYAFAPAQAPEQGRAGGGAGCRLIWGDREITLAPGENVLGRTHDAAVWIDSPSVSRRHARIVVSGSEAVLLDCGSKNGTFLRGSRVDAPAPLEDRDEIRLGSVRMTFRIVSDDGTTETAST